MITWEELVQLEPRLLELYRQIQAVRNDKSARSFCANAHWYGALPGTYEDDETVRYHGTGSWFAPRRPPRSFKDHLVRLVGYYAERRGEPRLRTSQAYHVAYRSFIGRCPTAGTVRVCRQRN
jgi:hypothetical protein